MTKIQESEIYGVIGTAIICGIIVLLLFLFGMKTMKEFPPYPSGVEIMFGDGADGAPAPEVGSMPAEASVPSAPPIPPQPTSSTPDILTQDDPSVALEIEKRKEQDKIRREQIKQEQIRIQQERAAREAAEAAEAARRQQAANISNQVGGIFGGGTGGGGNSASGMGPGGGGTGNIPGNPLGKGSGIVGGTGWSLAGRDWKGGGMKPSYVGTQTGVIIVSIRVDKNGNVVTASIKQKGTTISDADQREECIRTAKQAKFSVSSEATGDALGEITYRFNQR